MTWQTIVDLFAVIGALYLSASVALLVVGLLLNRNADALNRHSSHR